MRVGFTGTRDGMTPDQMAALARWWFARIDIEEFHHGGCVGADEQAVASCRFYTTARAVAHPGDIQRLTSREAMRRSPDATPVKPCLDRNRDIVDAADILLASPKGPEELRSGTWATVRYARKCGKPIVIFWPDGAITEEGV